MARLLDKEVDPRGIFSAAWWSVQVVCGAVVGRTEQRFPLPFVVLTKDNLESASTGNVL